MARRDDGVVLAADGDQVPVTGGPGGTFLLDLEQDTVHRIGPAPHDMLDKRTVDLSAGMVRWIHAGPMDDRRTYDVVWKFGRLP